MGCKKVSIRIAKEIATAVSPTGIKFIASIVQIVAQTDWSNSEKRETSVDLAMAEARQAGREVRENAIRAAVEAAVVGLKNLGAEIEQLGNDPAGEVEEKV